MCPPARLRDAGLPLGEIIPGTQYRVLAKLGRGGMGTVYSAEHVALEKRVALKLLRPEMARAHNAVERLRDEARAASRIGSQFICDVTDFGQTPDGRVFFVMEYLDGSSLGRVLRSGGPLPPARALPILRQIAKGLQAAHEKGIVHLDLKPDNVMLLARGRRADQVKLVDFGAGASCWATPARATRWRARRNTSRPNASWARPTITGPTSTPWACWPTRSSPARSPSAPPAISAPSPNTSRSRRPR